MQNTSFNNNNDYISKGNPSYGLRRFKKIIYRTLLATSLLTLCYILGRNVQWGQLDYNFRTKDIDIVQYFCNQERFLDRTDEKSMLDMAKNNLLSSHNNKYHAEHAKVTHLQPDYSADEDIPMHVWNELPVRGAYYMIVRNEDLFGARETIRSMEDHMTNGTKYPWIILGSQYFTDNFRSSIRNLVSSPVYFGKIDPFVWDYPYFIDVARVEYFMRENEFKGVVRGGSPSYHHLLRYQAGFFFHHPLFRNVEYSWRLEAKADYSCQMDEDMFLYMKENNKTLGFALTMKEASNTIPTLWERVVEFTNIYPEFLIRRNESILPWIVDEVDQFNNCHIWNNFQIADLSFFRSEAYQRFFEYLDNTGNFFYER
ncbi:glycolipid 2-alpha-mannosyltransferase-domain-containing protein [Pilobolus umbonatus]|nr:glycolipid 2-alpha-mannosyltransferase-domain-containing protein [Pilobolus umbonatus]